MLHNIIRDNLPHLTLPYLTLHGLPIYTLNASNKTVWRKEAALGEILSGNHIVRFKIHQSPIFGPGNLQPNIKHQINFEIHEKFRRSSTYKLGYHRTSTQFSLRPCSLPGQFCCTPAYGALICAIARRTEKRSPTGWRRPSAHPRGTLAIKQVGQWSWFHLGSRSVAAIYIVIHDKISATGLSCSSDMTDEWIQTESRNRMAI